MVTLTHIVFVSPPPSPLFFSHQFLPALFSKCLLQLLCPLCPVQGQGRGRGGQLPAPHLLTPGPPAPHLISRTTAGLVFPPRHFCIGKPSAASGEPFGWPFLTCRQASGPRLATQHALAVQALGFRLPTDALPRVCC